MYKQIVFIVIGLIFADIKAQDVINRTTIDTTKMQEILIGPCDRNALFMPLFVEYWDLNYESYEVKPELVEKLNAYTGSYRVLIVFGSWCGDSQDQLPRFFKIADMIGLDNIELIAVDRKKSAPGLEEQIIPLNIEKVPTFIVYIGDTEIGRIIETPQTTLEEDLLRILEKL